MDKKKAKGRTDSSCQRGRGGQVEERVVNKRTDSVDRNGELMVLLVIIFHPMDPVRASRSARVCVRDSVKRQM